jgi:hypothetical protein
MNEYLDPASPARLIGTFSQPDGLLTSAVRRQPFCVLLLDEIEKAHPSVFDLLLQVLGEGRLTDSLGRTSDFTNAVVIMTSNLGTARAASTFGLRPAAAPRDDVFTDAAKAFFRPEFFNRIDRIVPFAPLGREQIAAIADRLIAELFHRDGLVQRRCVLDVHPAAMSRIIDQGYHPDLGARALKRAIERQLTAPIAMRLASLAPDVPTLVSIYSSGPGVAPQVQPLVNVESSPPRPTRADAAEINANLDRVEAYVNDVEAQNVSGDSGSVRVSADALSAAHFRYFAVREQIGRIDRLIRQIDQSVHQPANVTRRAPRVRTPRRVCTLADAADEFRPLLARADARSLIAPMLHRARPFGDEPVDHLNELLDECALLQALRRDDGDRALISLRPLGGRQHDTLRQLTDAYLHLFSRQQGFLATLLETGDSTTASVLIEMPGVAAVVAGEQGTHLFYPPHENVLPVQVIAVPLAPHDDPQSAAQYIARTRETWRSNVAAGRASADSDPYPLGPVVRVYDPVVGTLDLRSLLLCTNLPTANELRRFVLAGLSLPEPLAAAS